MADKTTIAQDIGSTTGGNGRLVNFDSRRFFQIFNEGFFSSVANNTTGTNTFGWPASNPSGKYVFFGLIPGAPDLPLQISSSWR
jgi:hypothetical protein